MGPDGSPGSLDSTTVATTAERFATAHKTQTSCRRFLGAGADQRTGLRRHAMSPQSAQWGLALPTNRIPIPVPKGDGANAGMNRTRNAPVRAIGPRWRLALTSDTTPSHPARNTTPEGSRRSLQQDPRGGAGCERRHRVHRRDGAWAWPGPPRNLRDRHPPALPGCGWRLEHGCREYVSRCPPSGIPRPRRLRWRSANSRKTPRVSSRNLWGCSKPAASPTNSRVGGAGTHREGFWPPTAGRELGIEPGQVRQRLGGRSLLLNQLHHRCGTALIAILVFPAVDPDLGDRRGRRRRRCSSPVTSAHAWRRRRSPRRSPRKISVAG